MFYWVWDVTCFIAAGVKANHPGFAFGVDFTSGSIESVSQLEAGVADSSNGLFNGNGAWVTDGALKATLGVGQYELQVRYTSKPHQAACACFGHQIEVF